MYDNKTKDALSCDSAFTEIAPAPVLGLLLVCGSALLKFQILPTVIPLLFQQLKSLINSKIDD